MSKKRNCNEINEFEILCRLCLFLFMALWFDEINFISRFSISGSSNFWRWPNFGLWSWQWTILFGSCGYPNSESFKTWIQPESGSGKFWHFLKMSFTILYHGKQKKIIWIFDRLHTFNSFGIDVQFVTWLNRVSNFRKQGFIMEDCALILLIYLCSYLWMKYISFREKSFAQAILQWLMIKIWNNPIYEVND